MRISAIIAFVAVATATKLRSIDADDVMHLPPQHHGDHMPQDLMQRHGQGHSDDDDDWSPPEDENDWTAEEDEDDWSPSDEDDGID